ncbi:MAG: type II secretion system protein [Gammaproteobacteria bacterium]|nr:type II secretion system protein [Gammaproteobacteria bacterium]
MRIKFCNIKMWKVKSEEGFTLLELIMVMVVTGTLSSAIILPFSSSIKNGTMPEIYNTATYIAVGELEKKKSDTFSALSSSIGTVNDTVTKKSRVYTKTVATNYVSRNDITKRFDISGTPTKLIRVIVTISNPGIDDFSISEIMAEDFQN